MYSGVDGEKRRIVVGVMTPKSNIDCGLSLSYQQALSTAALAAFGISTNHADGSSGTGVNNVYFDFSPIPAATNFVESVYSVGLTFCHALVSEFLTSTFTGIFLSTKQPTEWSSQSGFGKQTKSGSLSGLSRSNPKGEAGAFGSSFAHRTISTGAECSVSSHTSQSGSFLDGKEIGNYTRNVRDRDSRTKGSEDANDAIPYLPFKIATENPFFTRNLSESALTLDKSMAGQPVSPSNAARNSFVVKDAGGRASMMSRKSFSSASGGATQAKTATGSPPNTTQSKVLPRYSNHNRSMLHTSQVLESFLCDVAF